MEWKNILDLTGKPKSSLSLESSDTRSAANFLIDWLEKQIDFAFIRGVGHRVVFGMKHTEPEWITPESLNELHRISPFDTDRLPAEIELIVMKSISQTRCQSGDSSEQKRKTKRKEWNMKNQTNTKLVIFLSLALALAIWAPVQVQSTASAAGKMMTQAKMMDRCQEMKDQKQKMMEDMKAQDAQLTEQLAKMNSAPDDKKVSLIAAVITQMVEQRIAMDARKAKMQEEMMQHMMQHMQMGKESMSQCPMMQGMKEMEDKSGDAHKEHHEEQK